MPLAIRSTSLLTLRPAKTHRQLIRSLLKGDNRTLIGHPFSKGGAECFFNLPNLQASIAQTLGRGITMPYLARLQREPARPIAGIEKVLSPLHAIIGAVPHICGERPSVVRRGLSSANGLFGCFTKRKPRLCYAPRPFRFMNRPRSRCIRTCRPWADAMTIPL